VDALNEPIGNKMNRMNPPRRSRQENSKSSAVRGIDAQQRRARTSSRQLLTGCVVALVLGILSTASEIGALKISDTQAMYTGLARKVGAQTDDSSYILSFGPDNDEIQLLLCMGQGYSGTGLAPDPTPDDAEALSVRCLADYVETEASSQSSPSVGVSSFDPISQVWFHANGEDGFASSYVTGVNVIEHGSIGQASVENENMETSFTLSTLEYNRADDSLFGVVTYSSGQHYIVAIKGSAASPLWDPSGTGHETDSANDGYMTSSDDRRVPWKRVLTFRHIYRLREATGVVPALSALEPMRQMYICIVIENNDPFLYVVGSGMDQGGNPLRQENSSSHYELLKANRSSFFKAI